MGQSRQVLHLDTTTILRAVTLSEAKGLCLLAHAWTIVSEVLRSAQNDNDLNYGGSAQMRPTTPTPAPTERQVGPTPPMEGILNGNSPPVEGCPRPLSCAGAGRVGIPFRECIYGTKYLQSALTSIMISKSRIVRQIIEELNRALETLAGAARVMHADASDEQNKAEDQYDTRGLETAYLASSQARQATETEQALAQYQSLKLQKFTVKTPIDLTALVELESGGTRIFYFLGPKGGGTEVRIGSQEILVITPESPLGRELIGKEVGDRIKLQTRGPSQEFRILSVR